MKSELKASFLNTIRKNENNQLTIGEPTKVQKAG